MILTPADYINWWRFAAAMTIALCDLTSWHMENDQ